MPHTLITPPLLESSIEVWPVTLVRCSGLSCSVVLTVKGTWRRCRVGRCRRRGQAGQGVGDEQEKEPGGEG